MPVVILTQPALRVAALRAALADAAFEVHHWPVSLIEAEPGLDWHAVARYVADARWTLFPSPASIDVVMSAFEAQQIDWPGFTGIGLIGPGSREALQRWVARVAGLGEVHWIEPAQAPFDADALLARAELQDLNGIGVVVLRRSDGREGWLQTIRQRGGLLTALSVYRMRPIAPPDAAPLWTAAQHQAGLRAFVSIASADAGARLYQAASTWPHGEWLLDQVVLTQHPRIAQELRNQGWRHVLEHAPGIDALVRRLESLRNPSR